MKRLVAIIVLLVSASTFAAQYARLNDQTGQLYDRTDGHAVAIAGRIVFWPDAATLNAAEYYVVPTVTGAVSRWSLADGRLVPEYAPPPPPAPVQYSKLKILRAVNSLGLYDTFAAFLGTLSPYQQECWACAQVVATDDSDFAQVLAAIPAALGITQEQVEALLAECIAD